MDLGYRSGVMFGSLDEKSAAEKSGISVPLIF
jgi:hypothetical protein